MTIQELISKIIEVKNKIMGLQNELEKEQMRDIIRKIAPQYGVDVEKAIKVAENESSLNPKCYTQNKDKRKSHDRGLWQINSFWHSEIPDECCYNPECSTNFFCKRVKQGYATEWYGAENVMWVYDKNGKKILT